MAPVRVLCIVTVGLFSWVSTTFAQTATPFVQRSSAPTRIATEREVVRQQRVDIQSPRDLISPARSAVLQLDLFPDLSFRAVRQRLDPTASGMSWSGVLEGYPDSSAVFVLSGDEVLAHLYTPLGFFRIQRDNGSSYLVQQVDQEMTDGALNDEVAAPGDAAVAGRDPFRTAAAPDNGTLIDVMVVYTPSAQAGFGSDDRRRATIDMVIAETNQAFRNTGVNTSVRLVYATLLDAVETGDSSTDLISLRSTTDGKMDEVHRWRTQYSADVVMLLVEDMRDACGIAYVNTPASSVLGTAGFAVLKRSCMNTPRSFAHELGHNLGIGHDWYTDASPGAFSYSKGYVSIAGRFLDLMAYTSLCTDTRTVCAQLLQYANPSIGRDGRRTGVPAGTDTTCVAGDQNHTECDADGYRTMNAMVARIASYRDSRTGPSALELGSGTSIRSANGRYRLLYQADGNLVLYDDVRQQALWSSGTTGGAGTALMQLDGNFVIYGADQVARWSTATTGPGNYLVLQNDGNLVVYNPHGQPLWGSGTAGS